MANNFVFQEEKTPKKFNLSTWASISTYVFKNWPYLIAIFISMVFTSFIDSSCFPLLSASIVSSIQQPHASNIIDLVINVTFIFGIKFNLDYIGLILFYVISILIRSLAIFINFYLSNLLVMHIVVDLRRDSFKKVQELSFSYYDKTPHGWLIARMGSDCSDIADMISNGFINLFWIFFDLIFILISMFSYNVALSFLVLAITPILIIIIPLFERIVLKLHRIARNSYSNFVRWLAECINGAKTIKILAIEGEIEKEADEITEDIRKKRRRAMTFNGFFVPIVSIASAITSGLIVLVGEYVLHLRSDVVGNIAIFTFFISCCSSIYTPITQFTDLFSEFMATQASVEKVLSLVNTKPAIVDTKEVIEKYGDIFNNKKENFEKMDGNICFKDVFFHYENGKDIITNFNLNIKKGETVAIVGETGSGKTTIVNLLCRFYEPTAGEILIDGEEYRNRSVGWIRSNIGYVQQNPFVFNTSYYNNLRYGNLNASDDAVKDVCKMIGIDDFINSQPQGYNTILNDSGNQLSTGQKQLLSFARALLRDPQIIILDEATSSIDTDTEYKIQKMIGTFLKGRTSIIIAHRLSTIVEADRIIVLDKGKIVEEGSHKQLIEKKGWYHHLYMNQFKELNIDEQIKTYEEQIEKKKIKL